jgi:hypothetical protein
MKNLGWKASYCFLVLGFSVVGICKTSQQHWSHISSFRHGDVQNCAVGRTTSSSENCLERPGERIINEGRQADPNDEKSESKKDNANINGLQSTKGRPPISRFLYENKTATTHVQSLLDYAIIGFSECGTTALGEWLHQHPQVKSPIGETCDFRHGIDSMAQALYANLPQTDDESIIKGYQCSHHVQNPIILKEIAEYFPKTKLIITVRHPLKWFETFYEMHLAQQDGQRAGLRGSAPSSSKSRPPAFMLTGGYHQYLAMLGKTSMLGPDERALIDPYTTHQSLENKQIINVSNHIFFADMSQFDDSNQTRALAFRQDLQQFLGLKEELSFMPLACQEPAPSSPNIDICSKAHAYIRTELMRTSRNASSWFRNYFLKSPDVVVSSRDYLESIFESWMIDPCEEATNASI